MEHMKYSTSRDFRINVAVLAERLDEEASDDVELSSDNEDDAGDNPNETTEEPDNEVGVLTEVQARLLDHSLPNHVCSSVYCTKFGINP